jgi:ABC-type transporter Mla subunit MlaD
LKSRIFKSNNLFWFFFLIFIASTVIFCLSASVGPLINSSKTIALFFYITTGISGIFLFLMYFNLRKRANNVEKTVEFLKTIDKSNPEAEFYKIGEYFKETDLYESWEQYNQSIRRIKSGYSPEGEEIVKYYSTVNAGYYFDEELLSTKYNTRLHNYIPSLMTAIGIFGTFLGLVIGLQSLILDDVENTKTSIVALISGVKVSFKSSLYGVAYSIILTFFQKAYLGSIENKISVLASELDKIFPQNTQEDGVKEIYFELEKQTSSLQKLATDFAEEVGKKFDSSIQGNLGPALIKLSDAADSLAKMSQSTSESAISEMIKSMGHMLSTATSGEMERLKGSLSEITSKNQAMFENFSSAIDKVQDLIENQREIITHTNSSATNVERTNEKVEGVTLQLENILASLSNYSKTQEMSNDDSRLLLGQIKEHIDYQNQSNAVIMNMLKETQSTLQLEQKIYDDLNETSRNLNQFNSQFKPVLDNIKDNIENFSDLSNAINNKFMTTMSRLENHYDKINDSMEGVFGILNNSVEQLKEDVLQNLTRINNQYLDITQQLNDFSEASGTISLSFKEFAATQEKAQSLWTSYKDSFDELNSNMKEGITDYTANVRNGLNDIFRQYDEHITNVLSNLSNTMQELNDNIEELSEVYEKENRGVV